MSRIIFASVHGKPLGKEAIIQGSKHFVDFEWTNERWKIRVPQTWVSNSCSAGTWQLDLGKLLNLFCSVFPVLSGHKLLGLGKVSCMRACVQQVTAPFTMITEPPHWATPANLRSQGRFQIPTCSVLQTTVKRSFNPEKLRTLNRKRVEGNKLRGLFFL